MNINYNSNEAKSVQALKPVRSTKQVISNVNALVGGILFAVGLLVFAIHFLLNNNSAILSLQISGGAIALSGTIELIISAFFRRSFRKEQAKLDRLKIEGLRFTGEITQVKRHMGVHFGRSFSVRAECTYINRDGKTCLVKSASFLYANENVYRPHCSSDALGASDCNNYTAYVYVCPYTPSDYAVEIFTQTAKPQNVYDYR